MHAFTDKAGVSWEIELTVGICEEVQDRLGIDLLDPLSEDSQLMVDLSPVKADNIRKFCKLLEVLCEDQYKAQEITVTQFAKVLNSATIKSAYEAFFLEWQDFFQSLDRKDMAEAMEKIREVMKEGVQRVIVEIKKIQSPINS